jgi:translation initiation factor 2 subunit 1
MENKDNCRYYENKFPTVDELVVVQVNHIGDVGAEVALLEYDALEGMILLSELTRRRIRSVTKLIRVGKQEVVQVVRVDENKGYIDLSKRRVSPEDIQAAENKYNKSKAVHSIMRHVAGTCGVSVLSLYEQFGWDLYKRFGHAHDAFTAAVRDAEAVFDRYEIEAKVKDGLLTNIRRKLTPQPVKVRAFIELNCFTYEGIDAIKRALLAGQGVGSEEMPVHISLIAPPEYVMTTTSLDKKDGIALLTAAVEAARVAITSENGKLNVKQAPAAVTDSDEKNLAEMMEKLTKDNQEYDGDEPED